jgi:putative transposase
MPRLPRIDLEGAIYFVTAKSSKEQLIFKDRADYLMYIELLAKYKSHYKFKLFSFCLMPEKLNLLIETAEQASISYIMHDLNSSYTKYYNGRYNRRGHLFEARFRSMLVEKLNYLLKMTRHTHQIPGENFKEYAFSSYPLYAGKAGAEGLLDLSEEIREVKALLNNFDDPNAYEVYCVSGNTEEILELQKKLARGSVLGSETFEDQVKNRLEQYSEEKKLDSASRKPNRAFVWVIGFIVIAASGATLYLYMSKSRVESEYRDLLKNKENTFEEKTRFQNRSPIALAELDGTEWDVELVPANQPNSTEVVKDRLVFVNGRFSSVYFGVKGFRSASYFLVPKGHGAISWQTAQSDPGGGIVRWSGEWQGDAMKGELTFQSADGVTQNFSFFSNQWIYSDQSVNETAGSAK